MLRLDYHNLSYWVQFALIKKRIFILHGCIFALDEIKENELKLNVKNTHE